MGPMLESTIARIIEGQEALVIEKITNAFYPSIMKLKTIVMNTSGCVKRKACGAAYNYRDAMMEVTAPAGDTLD